MGCGTPVIASKTPGNREWIQGEVTGDLFEVADSIDLARALRQILRKTGSDGMRAVTPAARVAAEARADWARNSSQLAAILRT